MAYAKGQPFCFSLNVEYDADCSAGAYIMFNNKDSPAGPPVFMYKHQPCNYLVVLFSEAVLLKYTLTIISSILE